MLTQADVDAIIQEWTRSPAGRAKLKEMGVGIYTPQEMKAIANELRLAIISAFISIQHIGGGFNIGATSVQQTGENTLSIQYGPAALRRESLLHSWDSKYSTFRSFDKEKGKLVKKRTNLGHVGNGVKDVFALFTQGWHAHTYVYGSWEDAYQGSYPGMVQRTHSTLYGRHYSRPSIRSRKDYEGNSFIKDTCAHFEQKYPGLKITIPPEWGG